MEDLGEEGGGEGDRNFGSLNGVCFTKPALGVFGNVVDNGRVSKEGEVVEVVVVGALESDNVAARRVVSTPIAHVGEIIVPVKAVAVDKKEGFGVGRGGRGSGEGEHPTVPRDSGGDARVARDHVGSRSATKAVTANAYRFKVNSRSETAQG